MIQLIPVNRSSEYEETLKNIYLDAFPPDERRDWKEIMELGQQPHFNLYCIIYNDQPAGLITVWKWPDLAFIEHFAVSPLMQGKGIGSEVIHMLKQEIPTPIILETEPPEIEAAIRRVAFYTRLDFQVCTEEYYQPPYDLNKKAVKMQLMSYPHRITPQEFVDIRARLYKEVYNRNVL